MGFPSIADVRAVETVYCVRWLLTGTPTACTRSDDYAYAYLDADDTTLADASHVAMCINSVGNVYVELWRLSSTGVYRVR